MSKEFFDYDPYDGMSYWEEDPITGVVTIEQTEDVEPLVERNKIWANESATDGGIKQGMWHYADIPMTMVLEMKKRGINLLHPSPGDWQALFREVETNYPYLKTTHKKMWRPH